ncbi:hypothetical protein [Paludisphaera borealis]|uniref:Cytochrome c domain-containing protein n=1 Tax=Paludisphaera borealis TaxID=1387353 RepID=A0A1U7CL97_9BACT|nr:hypothetical protein [Paludisphaera borealis]APW59714.1 hypothetical protein BSF38_01145 [Paludisphaera borealis]
MRRIILALAVCVPLGLGWISSVPLPMREAGAEPPSASQDPARSQVEKKSAAYGGAEDGPGYDRSSRPDSFRYYGPNGLWAKWNDAQKLGRNTWLFYTAGDQKFYRILAEFAGESGVSIDFYRLLDSNRRPVRFREVGLVNEPNFVQANEGETDEYGFHVDKWKGDPEGCYDEATGAPLGPKGEPLDDPAGKKGSYPWNPKWYGEPTGIMGLRKFPNPAFNDDLKKAWLADPIKSVRAYFKNPGKVQPPHIFGITCGFCHVAFDPLNPPKDPANPRWENLAANMGNQYLREGDLFFGAGRIVGGDANPGSKYQNGDGDPYDTKGLGEASLIYQYGHTQQPGTSETSRFSYDFINNPNTINQIINIGHRRDFKETAPDGSLVTVKHILKDGSDSVGLTTALLRVFVNIGEEGDYWADHLWNPATGTPQSPFQLKEVQGFVNQARWSELRKRYPQFGDAWAESKTRVNALVSYLASYGPYSLDGVKDKDGRPYLSQDAKQLARGAELFVQNCMKCHSSDQPKDAYPESLNPDVISYYRNSLAAKDVRLTNTFTDDVRYPFNYEGLGINAARAMATNAIDGDIWAELSSKDYKALPPLMTMKFANPLNLLDPGRFGGAPIVTEFVAPGGGRGYYRSAALNSMWATAPFLHNNSIGVDPVSKDATTGEEYLDAKYVSIEGRLELFEKAMDHLLNPDNRPLKIKVTSADSGLIGELPGVRPRVDAIIRDLGKQQLHELIQKAVGEAVDDVELPDAFKPLRPSIKKGLLDLLVVFDPVFKDLYTKENFNKVKQHITDSVHEQIDKVIREKIAGRPKLEELVAAIKPKFDAELEKKLKELDELIPHDLIIPKGTPLNLLLNLNAARAPHALKFYLKNKGNERLVVEELLKLSDCPDLVENRGHTYGSELKPSEKRDLIEFLKTL